MQGESTTTDEVVAILQAEGAARRELGERVRREREPTAASVREERDPLGAKLLGERARRETAAEWLEDLQEEAKRTPGVIVRQETLVGTIRVFYHRGQAARYSDGQYAGEFFHCERRLPSGMWDYVSEDGALALLAQAIERGAS